GRAMLEALVQGTTDPAMLAELARGRLRGKLPALRQALAGRFRGPTIWAGPNTNGSSRDTSWVRGAGQCLMLTSATGTWERTPWHATQRAAWEALRPADFSFGSSSSSRLGEPAATRRARFQLSRIGMSALSTSSWLCFTRRCAAS